MTAADLLLATLRFVVWEAALFAISIQLVRRFGWRLPSAEGWLAALSVEVTLESSIAGSLSFSGLNSQPAYWSAAAICAIFAALLARKMDSVVVSSAWKWPIRGGVGNRLALPLAAALTAPLILLSFRPVSEADSVNYLHFLLEWMANRATPYLFATNYVAFWELSFVPAWMVTRVDVFFPLAALKGVALLALALWLAGRELGLRGSLLFWAVFSAVTMRHLWFGYSGVPTLKNDALHGAGFVLLTLVLLRAGRGTPTARDIALAAFGASFALVKYTGLFLVCFAGLGLLWLERRRIRNDIRGAAVAALGISAFAVLTSGHYYARNLWLHGSPFYPFQINLGFIHLPGTADLSHTSILYNLHDPRLWRALFWPAGISPAGLLFPVILPAGLALAGLSLFLWRRWSPPVAGVGKPRQAAYPTMAIAGAAILCGWALYFRSVYGASAFPGDLSFLLNSLNSLRYVEGVLGVTELFLVALLVRWPLAALALLAVHGGSRLFLLYSELQPDVFPWAVVFAAVFLAAAAVGVRRAGPAVAIGLLLVAAPLIVERNRAQWTAYWNDLKPALSNLPAADLAQLAMPDGSFFAGQPVAAGNPVRTEIRAFLPADLAALEDTQRPRWLAILSTPGSPGWERFEPQLREWGYRPLVRGEHGIIFERSFR